MEGEQNKQTSTGARKKEVIQRKVISDREPRNELHQDGKHTGTRCKPARQHHRTQRELEQAENLLSVGRSLLDPSPLDPSTHRDPVHTGQSLSDSCRGLLDLISRDNQATDKPRQYDYAFTPRPSAGGLLNPELGSSKTLSRPTGARLKKSKSCQRDSAEPTVPKGVGERRMKKQRSEGAYEPYLADEREYAQGLKVQDVSKLRYHNSSMVGKTKASMELKPGKKTILKSPNSCLPRSREMLLHASQSLDERKTRISRQKKMFGGTFDSIEILPPPPTITLRRPSEPNPGDERSWGGSTYSHCCTDPSKRCWAQHESGTSESATVYQGEAGYIQQDTGLSDCSGLLDNIVTCSEMEETIFCNQDYLGFPFNKTKKDEWNISDQTSDIQRLQPDLQARGLSGQTATLLSTSVMSPGKSEGTISPIRTPSTSPARTSLSGACSLMFPYSQSPVMDKSPILSPTPGRSPFKSPSVSPSRANVHSPLSFWNCGGLTKKNDGNNISGGNRTFLQQQFDELGAPGSSPSRGLEDISSGLTIHSCSTDRELFPNGCCCCYVLRNQQDDEIGNTVNHTHLMDPQHFPKHVERGLQIPVENPDLKSADRTLNNSADYAHGAFQTEHLTVEVPKTCFCGFYTEENGCRGTRKSGRCKFCRSRAKYLPGQRSLDNVSSKLFRRKKGMEIFNRRAVSADRYSENDNIEVPVGNSSSLGELDVSESPSSRSPATRSPSIRSPSIRSPGLRSPSSRSPGLSSPSNRSPTIRSPSKRSPTNRSPSSRLSSTPRSPSLSSRPHPFRRQARMDAGDGDDARARARTDLVESEHDTWIRGRSEANPDSVLEAEGRIKPPSSLDINQDYKDPFPVDIREYYHIPGPAPDIPKFPHGLCVPLPRQQSIPYSYLNPCPRRGHLDRAHTAPPAPDRGEEGYPASPPPPYEEIVKFPQPPPTYDEATINSAQRRRQGFEEGSRSLPGNRSELSRENAEDIPDIYWQQAARELDFCTCRKCQARYRQYFEDEPFSPVSSNGIAEAILPLETQVMMQDLLSDGMAFCSLM